jgi:hypothetical protein
MLLLLLCCKLMFKRGARHIQLGAVHVWHTWGQLLLLLVSILWLLLLCGGVCPLL